MKLSYFRTTLLRYTFDSAKTLEWVVGECEGRVLNLFAGLNILPVNEVRNDINEEMPADHHMDAVDFLVWWRDKGYFKFNTIILDPPYSYRKGMRKYEGRTCSNFRTVKDLIPEVLEEGGKVITFGYHSVSMGRSRDFEPEQLLVIGHGGAQHDTLVIVERLDGV
jgi:hypothetical protein